MKCKWIKKLTAGIIFLAAVGSLSGCQKAATSENLFRDIEVNMTSVESAEENQIVKLQMGDGDSAISQESNLDIEMIRDPEAVHRKGQQKTNMAGTKETQGMKPGRRTLLRRKRHLHSRLYCSMDFRICPEHSAFHRILRP